MKAKSTSKWWAELWKQDKLHVAASTARLGPLGSFWHIALHMWTTSWPALGIAWDEILQDYRSLKGLFHPHFPPPPPTLTLFLFLPSHQGNFFHSRMKKYNCHIFLNEASLFAVKNGRSEEDSHAWLQSLINAVFKGNVKCKTAVCTTDHHYSCTWWSHLHFTYCTKLVVHHTVWFNHILKAMHISFINITHTTCSWLMLSQFKASSNNHTDIVEISLTIHQTLFFETKTTKLATADRNNTKQFKHLTSDLTSWLKQQIRSKTFQNNEDLNPKPWIPSHLCLLSYLGPPQVRLVIDHWSLMSHNPCLMNSGNVNGMLTLD